MYRAVSTIKKELMSFLDASYRGNETFFLAVFFFFVLSNIVLLINWRRDIFPYVWKSHFYLFTIVMWGSAIYLYSILAEWRYAWKRIKDLILIGLFVFALVGIISKVVTTDSYVFVMGFFFCVMAYGKKFDKIIFCLLTIVLGSLLIAYICLKLGITMDAVKPNRIYGGHSLGILHPNDWGYFVFLAMVIIWYLWLKNKKFISIICFWPMSVFMYKYITCQTIAALTFIFPIMGIVAEVLQEKTASSGMENRRDEEKNGKGIMYWITVLSPFIVLTMMLLLCSQMEWIHDHFYKTPLESLAMRFVEGGYALKLNGISLVGHPFKQWENGIVDYAERIELIVDSAFIAFLIIRGAIWMFITLIWLSFAHIRGIQKNDYRIIAISLAFLIFSIMERPGLNVWYNFVLLYPLASLAELRNNQPEINGVVL